MHPDQPHRPDRRLVRQRTVPARRTATAAQLATLDCPTWCSPGYHDHLEGDGTFNRRTHVGDHGTWCSFFRDDQIDGAHGPVSVAVLIDDTDRTPAELRAIAAELLAAADAAEASP